MDVNHIFKLTQHLVWHVTTQQGTPSGQADP